MTKISDTLMQSARELKKTRALVYTALLLALQVSLGLLTGIPLGPSVRVSFGYLALSITGALFGPVPAMINGALSDILLAWIRPLGEYFPGFTISGILGGFVYGCVFYKREIKLSHILLAKAIIDVFINLGLNTFWLNLLYGKAFLAMLPARALKNILQYPVDAILLLPIAKLVGRLRGQLEETR